MNTTTFICTVHEDKGMCNADELYAILENINPEVVFLEAIDETYSNYDKQLFSLFQVYHKKLEIAAIQKYTLKKSFSYIPVLDEGLSNTFDITYNSLPENTDFETLLTNFNKIASKEGFQFLNSAESMRLQEEMRTLEKILLNNSELYNINKANIDEYENSMIKNIYSICKDTQFENAVFMCGVAHRKSIIEKIKNINTKENPNINWVIYGD